MKVLTNISVVFDKLKKLSTFNFKPFFFILRILVLLLTSFYLYKKVLKNQDFYRSLQEFQKFDFHDYLLIVLVFVLMFLNWGLESKKWQYLVSKIQKLTFFTSFKAIFSGITISIWLPNRVAEYIGRIVYVEHFNKIKATLSTIVGSFSQLLITILFGSFGLFFYLQTYKITTGYLSVGIMFLIVHINLLLFFLFFKINRIDNFFSLSQKFPKLKDYIRVFSLYDNKDLFKILLLSLSRYVVFLSQYYILLQIFDISISYHKSFFLISLVFFIQSIVPSTIMTDIGIRGAVGIYFFEEYSINNLHIIVSTNTLWFINIIIPTVIGLLFLLIKKA